MGATGKFSNLGVPPDANVIKAGVEAQIPGLAKAMETMPDAYENFMDRQSEPNRVLMPRSANPYWVFKP
jgi:hypothetical protein